MVLLSTLAALTAMTAQGSTVTLAGRVVPVSYPEMSIRQVPDEVKNWDGFQGLADKEWPTPFLSVGDWSGITQKLGSLGPVPKDKPTWKTKIYILTQTDSAEKTGNVWQHVRQRLDQRQMDSVLKSIARTQGFVRAVTDDAVIPTFDVEIDNEPAVFSAGSSAATWLMDYVGAKVNKGRFDAEDKVFRGPWDSVIVITPASNFVRMVGGVSVISAFAEWPGNGECYGLENQIANQIASSAYERMGTMKVFAPASGGGQGEWSPQLVGFYSPKVWTLLQSSPEPTLEAVTELNGMAGKFHDDRDNLLDFPTRPAPISSNVQVSIVADDQRGSVLKYAENSSVRSGGFALPYKSIDIAKTPFLSFWAKSASRDGMRLNIADGSSMTHFGRRLDLPVPNDGAWHQVVVDLRNRDRSKIAEMVLGPVYVSERQQVGDIAYFFDDFQLSATGQPNIPDALLQAEETKRAIAAKDLSASDLAKDPSDLVKLNGLMSHEGAYAASDEAALTELAKSVNVRIAGEAVRRLAELGTPTAKAEVLRLVTASPFEYVKQCAAIELGKLGDPKTAGIMSRLFASKSWQTRNAGAKAISMLPGDEAAVVSMTFLQETEPLVRLSATKGANIQNAVVIKRLLWSTVNDPSDAVRTMSAWRLINSGKPKEAGEGYKAIRDDSVGVRLDLLRFMAVEPAEAHRGAIRIAVTDLSPRVRAAALAALAKLPGEVKIEEVANTLEDKLPIVQLALIDLVKAKNLTLPPNAVANLKASIDPRVVDAAKEFGL